VAEHAVPKSRKIRLSPGLILLVLGLTCYTAGFASNPIGRLADSQSSTWMFFLFSWFLPLIAIPISVYQLARNRSVQFGLEICLEALLVLVALSAALRG